MTRGFIYFQRCPLPLYSHEQQQTNKKPQTNKQRKTQQKQNKQKPTISCLINKQEI